MTRPLPAGWVPGFPARRITLPAHPPRRHRPPRACSAWSRPQRASHGKDTPIRRG